MSGLKRARTAIVGDLTRPRHMLAVSAVIMGATFLPIFGGLPRPSELAELRAVFFAPEAIAAEPAEVMTIEALHTDGEARVQRVASVEQEAELTSLALDPAQDSEPSLIDADAEAIGVVAQDEGLVVDDAASEGVDENEPVMPVA
jgi:hypothetical protein